jgi:putative endopeptidase
MNRRFQLIVLLALAAPAWAEPTTAPSSGSSAPTLPSDYKESVLSAMDRSVDPCDDFYRYACGGWTDKTPLPADESEWVRSFSTIAEHNRQMINDLLEDASKDPGPAGTERQKIGDFYGTCMDEATIEKAGLDPLSSWLKEIGAVDSIDAVFAESGKLARVGAGPFLRIASNADFKSPDLEIAYLFQGGLGLPDRDYYVSDDPKKKEILADYGEFVTKMLGLAGESPGDAAADSKAIVALETELAKVSRDRVALRQVEKQYNRMDRVGLEKLTPTLPWNVYFSAAGHPELVAISVATPEFFAELAKIVAATPMPVLRAYLRWNLINGFADQLPTAFVDANFEFYGKTLSGQSEIEPRWKRCVRATNAALGEAIGKLYVEREFPGDSKQVALEMIHGIEGAFEANLSGLAWMDDATRRRAVEKARMIDNKIGYPDRWRDYSKLEIAHTGYLANAAAAAAFEYDRQRNKVGKPVDKKEWGLTPQEVNAYYNEHQNEIVFPAGVLQPPFFRRDYPAAMNFGAIGAAVGHELTHGFDDQGRKFDGTGQLREWWEPQVAEKFESAAKCVSDQFSTYEAEPGVKVNGELTLGENIADLGGVKEAYSAYKAWEKENGAPAPAVPGLTNDQLLFVSWAQVWCTKSSPEYLRQQVTTDFHSPNRIRAIAAPRNSAAFREAFGCKVGDAMAPADACTVW